jgi:2-dehydropantoate 2-reductase
MKRHGLRLSGTCGEHVIPVKALHLHEAQSLGEPFDLAFIAVKSYDTEWATHLGRNYLKPEGLAVDFQNGINDERVAAIAGKERTLGCVILIGAGLYEPGHAMRTDTGTAGFKIGEHDGKDTPRAQALAKLLSDVAPTHVTANLWGERWSKLAINCMVNAIAGLSGLGTAECRIEPLPRRLSVFLAAEAIQVGRAAGHDVEPMFGIDAQRFVDAAQGRGMADVERDLTEQARQRGGGRPSMLQDVMRKRRTEIDHLNGYVSRHGRERGVPTPINDAVVAEMHRRGIGFTPNPQHLEPIATLLPR